MLRFRQVATSLFLLGGASSVLAQSSPTAPLPRIASSNGRHALLVDGRPFLVLGAQVNNSSNYEAMLPRVWPTVRALHANTVEVPVAWEQVEPVEGHFDFSFVDTVVRQARANGMRLVLLWFGTWKNTGPSYAPEWVKVDPARFPRMKTRDGRTHYVLSPHGRATLEADKRAFVALMGRLRAIDPRHTVILVQVENEAGSYGSPRDFSPEAQRLFEGAVPGELLRALGKQSGGSWGDVFAARADQVFNAWYTARYINEIAAAGKAVLRLPMYCNASLSNPFSEQGAENTASGGPNWNVIEVWKAAAPDIDLVAPDIYAHDARTYLAYLDHYRRSDNALFVPETGNSRDFARFFWPVLGRGAIGFAPFGMDSTGYSNFPLGARELDAPTIAAFAANYRLFAPIAGDWARIVREHPTWGAAKPPDNAEQSTTLGRWRITARFGLNQFGEPEWNPEAAPPPWAAEPVGGAVVAQLGPDEFLVAGSFVRVRFAPAGPAPGENSQVLSAEEGTFENGRWRLRRRWNGDQMDYGFNFGAEPVLLRVRLGTYR